MAGILSFVSVILAILIFHAFVIRGSSYRFEPWYPRFAAGMERIGKRLAYLSYPPACLIILLTGWNFAPIGWYFVWVGVFTCIGSLTLQAIQDDKDYDDLSFGNLALDILLVMPLTIAFVFGAIAFLIAIAAQLVS